VLIRAQKILIFSLLCIGLVGCGNPITGTLLVDENEQIEVSDDGGDKNTLNSGPSSIQLENAGWGDSSKILMLENNGQKMKIKIPESAFLSANDFSVTANEIQQDFDLAATTKRSWVGPSRIEKINESCTYSGYCASCGITMDGNIECGTISFKTNCSGLQNAIVAKRDYRDVTSVAFIKNGVQVGEFTSDAKIKTMSEVIERIGLCQ